MKSRSKNRTTIEQSYTVKNEVREMTKQEDEKRSLLDESNEDLKNGIERLELSGSKLSTSIKDNVRIANEMTIRINRLNELLHQSFEGDEEMLEEFQAAKKVSALAKTNEDLLTANDELKTDIEQFKLILKHLMEQEKEDRVTKSKDEHMVDLESETSQKGKKEIEALRRERIDLLRQLESAKKEVDDMREVLATASMEEEEQHLVHQSYIVALQEENAGLRKLLEEEDVDAGNE